MSFKLRFLIHFKIHYFILFNHAIIIFILLITIFIILLNIYVLLLINLLKYLKFVNDCIKQGFLKII